MSSLNHSLLSINTKNPRPNTHAAGKRARDIGMKNVAYIVPKRDTSQDFDSMSQNVEWPHNQVNGRYKGMLLSPQNSEYDQGVNIFNQSLDLDQIPGLMEGVRQNSSNMEFVKVEEQFKRVNPANR